MIRSTLGFGLALGLAALLSAPGLVRAQDAEPAPDGEATPSEDASEDGPSDDARLADDLTLAGATLFGLSYGFTGLTTTVLVVVANTRGATIAESWVPVVGPWVMLGDSRGFNTLQLVATVASGVVQAGSLAMLIAGLVMAAEARDDGARDDGTRDDGTRDDGARDDAARDDGARDEGARDDGAGRAGPRLTLLPVATDTYGGLSLVGTF